MSKKGLIIFIVLSVSIVSCAFVPAVSDEQAYAQECPMFTRSLTLSIAHLEGDICSHDEDVAACLFAAAVILPAGSFLVSGSLVLAGNTLHWLEYEASCENGTVLRNYHKLKHKLEEA